MEADRVRATGRGGRASTTLERLNLQLVSMARVALVGGLLCVLLEEVSVVPAQHPDHSEPHLGNERHLGCFKRAPSLSLVDRWMTPDPAQRASFSQPAESPGGCPPNQTAFQRLQSP